jgi:hypothetical protein
VSRRKTRKPAAFEGGMLPDGRFTTSDRTYVREWRRAAKIVARALSAVPPFDQYVRSAYDPGLVLLNKRTGAHVEVDGWTVRAVLRLTLAEDYAQAHLRFQAASAMGSHASAEYVKARDAWKKAQRAYITSLAVCR